MAAKTLSQNRSKTVLSKGDHFQARSDRNLGFRAHVGIKTATECRVDQPAAGRGAAGGKTAVDGKAISADSRVQYHHWETQAGVQRHCSPVEKNLRAAAGQLTGGNTSRLLLNSWLIPPYTGICHSISGFKPVSLES